MNPLWPMGVDIFAEWDSTNEFNNFGPGKHHPGMSLYNSDGKEVPVLFATTPNTSMNGSVLLQSFKEMDRLDVTERGTDEDGKEYYPFALVDGHVLRIKQDFLVYVNDPATRWGTGLGAPYGTSIWQFHDYERQNGTLKKALAKEKSAFFAKKREHGLPAGVRRRLYLCAAMQ